METLFELTRTMQDIEDALYENGGELTPELETAMSETRESLLQKVDNYNSLIQKLTADSNAIDAEIKRLQKLQKTVRNAKESIKGHILYNMSLFGLDRLEGRYCRMSIRRNSSLEVDEAEVLKPYAEGIEWLRKHMPDYLSVEVKVSKSRIADTYKGTGVLPGGICSTESTSLIIR